MKSSDYLIYLCPIHKDKLTSTFLKKNEYIIRSTSGGLSHGWSEPGALLNTEV